jgi:hypothetical protein
MVSKRSLRSGVMNQNNASRDESPSRRRRLPSTRRRLPAARPTPRTTRRRTIRKWTTPAPRPQPLSATAPTGTCEARHPLHGPAAAEGGATLSRIWMELRLAQQKG